MWTKEKIEIFMQKFGFNPIFTKPEIKELSSLLHLEETLFGLLEGQLKKIHNKYINGVGLVIATDKRIIFFRKSIIGTVTKEEIPITRVSSASYRKGILTSSIAIITANNESVVEQCDKNVAKKFIDVVLRLISELDNKPTQSAIPQPIQSPLPQYNNNLAQIEKLFELKEKGILTEEEFLVQKTRLLAQ